MPRNADGPKWAPQIITMADLTAAGYPPPETNNWKKVKKAEKRTQEKLEAKLRAARLAQDRERS